MNYVNTRIDDEIDMLRDSVRRFADAEIAPLAAEIVSRIQSRHEEHLESLEKLRHSRASS